MNEHWRHKYSHVEDPNASAPWEWCWEWVQKVSSTASSSPVTAAWDCSPTEIPLPRLANGLPIIAVPDKGAELPAVAAGSPSECKAHPIPAFRYAPCHFFLHCPSQVNPKAVLIETRMVSFALSNKSFSTPLCLGCACLFCLCTHQHTSSLHLVTKRITDPGMRGGKWQTLNMCNW